jgi:hypothetical protein
MTSGGARTHLRPARRDADRAISRGAKCFGTSETSGPARFAARSTKKFVLKKRRRRVRDVSIPRRCHHKTSRHLFASTTAAVCGPTADVASGLNSRVPLSYFIVLSTPLGATVAGPAAP